MNKTLTDNWNSVVQPNDIVYIIGDFAYKMAKRLSTYVKPLNGHKHIILGNHDRLPRIEYEQQFESVHDYLRIEIDKQTVILLHYPMLSWDKRARGSFHLYGHVHVAGQLKQLDGQKAYNVGVDVNNFFPVSYTSILKIMEMRTIKIEKD